MHGHSQLVTGPVLETLTLAEAKDHLRIDFNEDNSYIETGLIPAARLAAENETNRKLITQTWKHYLDAFPFSASIRLPFGQLQSVSSLKYTDSDDAETTVATSVYDAVTWEDPGRIVLSYGESWPSATLRSAGGVVVEFVCGYGDSGANVPMPIRQAMLLMIGHWYKHREEVVIGSGVTTAEVPATARALLWPYRILSI